MGEAVLPETYNFVQDVLAKGNVTAVTSGKKMGKTTFLTQLAVCASQDSCFLGYYTPKAKVLYVCLGEDYEAAMLRAEKVSSVLDTYPQDGRFIMTFAEPEDADADALAAMIADRFCDYDPDLVILDGMKRPAPPENGDVGSHFNEVMKDLCRTFGCAVVYSYDADTEGLLADFADMRINLGFIMDDVKEPRCIYVATRDLKGKIPGKLVLEYPVFRTALR